MIVDLTSVCVCLCVFQVISVCGNTSILQHCFIEWCVKCNWDIWSGTYVLFNISKTHKYVITEN